jgi:hypothetical protein
MLAFVFVLLAIAIPQKADLLDYNPSQVGCILCTNHTS